MEKPDKKNLQLQEQIILLSNHKGTTADDICGLMTSYSLYFSVQKQSWPDVWSLWGLWARLDNESIQTVAAKCKGGPPTLRSMQQAATLWLLVLRTLPDGGLITGTACSLNPWVSPSCLDTMQDAKLCLSLYWTVTLLFAWSICLPHSLILFRSLPRCTPRFLTLCCLLYSNIREIRREILE